MQFSALNFKKAVNLNSLNYGLYVIKIFLRNENIRNLFNRVYEEIDFPYFKFDKEHRILETLEIGLQY